MSVWQRKQVPWNSPGEMVIWGIVLILATLFIHNTIRKWREGH